MKRSYEFLKEAGVFYLATVDGGRARVRPFGAVARYRNTLYFCTNNEKPCYAQMRGAPAVEICACKGSAWVRIAGTAVFDEGTEAKKAMLEANPGLSSLYAVDDGRFEVFYLADATATFYAFGKQPETEPIGPIA